MTRSLSVARLGLGPVWSLRRQDVDAAPAAQVSVRVPASQASEMQLQDSSVGEPAGADDHRSVARSVRETEARSDGGIGLLDWEPLAEQVSRCTDCVLCEQRRQAVFGVGDRQAEWLFVGEGPGAEEDLRGEPFVGQAGKLLDQMLAAIGMGRNRNVYIANAVKCRPPFNRTPEPAEMDACFPYLQRQIALIKPRIIVALGRSAAQSLLKMDVRIGALRGKIFRYEGIPVIVTYHPAYLLRNPGGKADVWTDLCLARRTLATAAE